MWVCLCDGWCLLLLGGWWKPWLDGGLGGDQQGMFRWRIKLLTLQWWKFDIDLFDFMILWCGWGIYWIWEGNVRITKWDKEGCGYFACKTIIMIIAQDTISHKNHTVPSINATKVGQPHGKRDAHVLDLCNAWFLCIIMDIETVREWWVKKNMLLCIRKHVRLTNHRTWLFWHSSARLHLGF